MGNKTKKTMRILLISVCLMFSVFGVYSLISTKTLVNATDKSKIIVTLDSVKTTNTVKSGWANRTATSYSNGYLYVTSKYTDIDGQITDPGREVELKDGDGFSFTADTDTFGNFSLDEYRYFQMKIKRTNCSSSKMQFYVWNDKNGYASRDFNIGNIDDKWVVITLDLYQTNSSKKAIWVYDENAKTTNQYTFTSITNEFEFNFDNLRVNLGREFLPNKKACVEYVAFYKELNDALSFKGNAEERISNAETILKDGSTKLNSLFGDADTEEKAIKAVSEQISNMALVGSEIIEYDYLPATVNEKGKVDFSVRLQSAGKEKVIENLTMTIDKIPSEPIMIRLNNQETIDKLRLADVTMTLEEDGYVKMTKINPRQEDCFFFEFDTPYLTDTFILQNYPYIKLKVKPMQVSGKFQIYYSDFINHSDNCRSFLTSWDTNQWQTIIIDMNKSLNSIEVLNLETGKTTIENCYDGAWGTGFQVVDYSGESSDFRFTFGRRDNLERTTYIEYVSFFPTLEMARNYDEEGEKFKADTVSSLLTKSNNGELSVGYGDALSVENAKQVALEIVEEEAKNCFVNVNTVKYVPAGYSTNGKYVFTAEIQNDNLNLVFTTPQICLDIEKMSDSSNVLWGFDSELALSEMVAENADSTAITIENSALVLSPENKGFRINVPFSERFSLTGYPVIKIRYKSSVENTATIDVINEPYKFGINFTLKKADEYTETILSISTLKQYYGNNSKVETFSTIGELFGLMKTFVMKLNGDITIDYIAFSTDLSASLNYDGSLDLQEKLDKFIDDNLNTTKDINNFVYSDIYNMASSNEEARENVVNRLNGLLEKDIALSMVTYGDFVEATAINEGYLEYVATFSCGGIFNRVEKSVDGKLTIQKIEQKIYEVATEEGNGDFTHNYHEFWGTDAFYDTKAGNYDPLFADSLSYNYTNYLYTENDMADIPNTFEFWLKLFKTEKGREQVIFNNGSIRIAVASNGNVKVKFSNFTGTTSNIDLFDSSWHHVGVVRNNATVTVYIDGVSRHTFNTTTGTSCANDKKAYSIGGELYNADSRLVANDVVVDVSSWNNNTVSFSNDSVQLGKDGNGFFKVDFYNSNAYSFTLQSKKYVRLLNDIENRRIVILTNNTIDGLFLAKDIIYSLSEENEKYKNIFGELGLDASSKAVLKFKDEESFTVNYHGQNYTVSTNVYGQTTIKCGTEEIASLCVMGGNNHKSSSFSTQILDTSLSGRIGKISIYSNARTASQLTEDAKLSNYDNESTTNALSLIKMDYSEVVSTGKIVYRDDYTNNDLRIYASGFYKTNLKTEDSSTFAIIGDVQNHVVKGKETFNDVIAKWILENKEKLNISAGFSVGDITQNATETEWKWVYDSFSQFDNVIPYLIALGNHDYPSLSGKGSESRDTQEYNKVWNYEKYLEINKAYQGFGVFEIGKMENAYLCFDVDVDGNGVADNKFILFAIEYGARDEVLEWVDAIAKKYSDRNAIYVTHTLMRINGMIDGELVKDVLNAGFAKESSVNEGIDVLEKVVKRNANFVAVYCGHQGASDLAFHSIIKEYDNRSVFISVTDMSAAGKYFPSNDCVIGLISFNSEGEAVNYMYSPLYSAYFNTDLIWVYSMDLIENRG